MLVEADQEEGPAEPLLGDAPDLCFSAKCIESPSRALQVDQFAGRYGKTPINAGRELCAWCCGPCLAALRPKWRSGSAEELGRFSARPSSTATMRISDQRPAAYWADGVERDKSLSSAVISSSMVSKRGEDR